MSTFIADSLNCDFVLLLILYCPVLFKIEMRLSIFLREKKIKFQFGKREVSMSALFGHKERETS